MCVCMCRDVGAVDRERVVAIVPIVLDAINFIAVEHHEWRSYGGWSWALVDYYDMNLTVRGGEYMVWCVVMRIEMVAVWYILWPLSLDSVPI